MYSGNWQSFRDAADESQHSQLLTSVKRRARSGGEVPCNSLRLRIKGPQTNTNKAESLDMLECRTLPGFRQDNDGHVRKKTVTIGLHQSSPPVAKLNFESQHFGIDVLHKIIWSDTGMRSRQAIGIPTDRDKICDAISICWDFSRNSNRCFPCAEKPFRRSCNDGLTETVSKCVLTTAPRRMPRQISKRIMKSEFRDVRANCRCHVRQITGFNRIASFAS